MRLYKPADIFSLVRRSILIKLALILFFSGLLVNLIVTAFMFFQMPKRLKNVMHANIDAYMDYLIADIGVPPDTIRAAELSRALSIGIRIDTPDFSWTSHEKEITKPRKNGLFRPHRPRFFSRMPFARSLNDSTRFEFNIHFVHRDNAGSWRHLGLLAVLTAIFVLHFWLVKKILKPIKYLSRGVKSISAGNLEQNIPRMSDDELGRLTDGFNTMVQNIKQRILARDQLLLDVSHELRSPITRIKIAMEFIPDGPKKQSILTDIRDIEKMITEILESERLGHGNGGLSPAPTDIKHLVTSVVSEFKNRRPPVDIQQPMPSVILEIDAERIRMVLRNVLDNAIKYSRARDENITVKLKKNNTDIRIYISDSGPGIPDGQMPYIFEPFYRVDNSRSHKKGGYGLGLSLCRKIMRAHGGDIRIGNNSGRGVTVELVFEEKTLSPPNGLP